MVSYFKEFISYNKVKFDVYDNYLLIYILLMILGATIGKACMPK